MTDDVQRASQPNEQPEYGVIIIWDGDYSNEWLETYADGRIQHRVENDRYTHRRRHSEPETYDEWVDIEHIKARWPDLIVKVEAALAELQALEPAQK